MTKPTQDAPEPGAQNPEVGNPSSQTPAARKSGGKGVWVGTAVGVGSAAIVAALLYANKKRG
ncbi:MAG TPA: hypothetical protein VF489_01565 [Sphingobium sp.]